MSDNPIWKVERLESWKDSNDSFNNRLGLEKWVVARLLEQFIADFDENLLHAADEPFDVSYETANFQVKEVMEPGRKRDDERKEHRQEIEAANDPRDLQKFYTPHDISFADIVDRCHKYSLELLNKYGPSERSSMDLICYFNYRDVHETPSTKVIVDSQDYRSFSVVSNRFRSVIYACSDAPEFLQKQVGTIYEAGKQE